MEVYMMSQVIGLEVFYMFEMLLKRNTHNDITFFSSLYQ